MFEQVSTTSYFTTFAEIHQSQDNLSEQESPRLSGHVNCTNLPPHADHCPMPLRWNPLHDTLTPLPNLPGTLSHPTLHLSVEGLGTILARLIPARNTHCTLAYCLHARIHLPTIMALILMLWNVPGPSSRGLSSSNISTRHSPLSSGCARHDLHHRSLYTYLAIVS